MDGWIGETKLVFLGRGDRGASLVFFLTMHNGRACGDDDDVHVSWTKVDGSWDWSCMVTQLGMYILNQSTAYVQLLDVCILSVGTNGVIVFFVIDDDSGFIVSDEWIQSSARLRICTRHT